MYPYILSCVLTYIHTCVSVLSKHVNVTRFGAPWEHLKLILMGCHVGNALSKIADAEEIRNQAWSPLQAEFGTRNSRNQTGVSFRTIPNTASCEARLWKCFENFYPSILVSGPFCETKSTKTATWSPDKKWDTYSCGVPQTFFLPLVLWARWHYVKAND
jgi:hypothetical protein